MVEGGLNELALFAGAGGGILGGKLLGWRTVCAVECDAYAASVLSARQNDGTLAPFPIWDDVCSFDGRPWRGAVDVISGGFPCQDISAAGKGAGIEGERSGLWVEMARIIREVRPRYVFVENSPMLTSRGLGTVLGDLAALGFDAEWGVLGAHHAGAPHRRDRIWILAVPRNPDSEGQPARAIDAEASGVPGDVADASSQRRARRARMRGDQRQPIPPEQSAGSGQADRRGEPGGCGQDVRNPDDGDWWQAEPALGRVADGVAHRVDRLRAIGNGQVPAVAALAWTELLRRLKEGA